MLKKCFLLSKTLFIILSIPFLYSAQLSEEVLSGFEINHYYVSPDGNDNAAGTFEQPWRTLEKANTALQSGDTVTFMDGNYSGIINPVSNGKNSKMPITFRSYNLHGATLNGIEGSNYIITLNEKHFITIDGFRMVPDRGGFGLIRNCSYITVKNCHMEYSKNIFLSLHFINSHYNRLLNNTICRLIDRTADSKIHGDGCRFTDSGHNLIEGNNFSKIGHSPLNFYANDSKLCSHNIVRNNCFHNGWGRNFEAFNPERCLFENNIISDSFNGAMSAGSASQPFFYNSIFRHNLIYDNHDEVIVSNSWDAMLGGAEPVTLEFVNSRIYNNTFANNPSTVWVFGTNKSDHLIRSNKFINNLFYRNGFNGDFTSIILGVGVSDDNIFRNNLFFGEQINEATFGFKGNLYTLNELNKLSINQFEQNIDAYPCFEDFENRCFYLSKQSPAVNSGRALTYTTKSGSGNTLFVEDACYFFDGFGIEGEAGDLIRVGRAGRFARVIHADIDKNVLTIDRNISWRSGDAVSLHYAGKSPDIGAFQYGNSGILRVIPMAEQVVANPGKEVKFSAIISGKKGRLEFEWDFGDGSGSKELSPVHIYDNVGDYVVRLRCSDMFGSISQSMMIIRVNPVFDSAKPLLYTDFEEETFEIWGHLWDRGPSRNRFTYYPETRDDGKGQCMCVSTGGGNKTIAVNVKLREWDIDQYPVIKFSYRIPLGVPVGIWLKLWPKTGRPDRICLGGSSSNLTGEYTNINEYKLIDDDEWRDITLDARVIRKIIPEIRNVHSFEFGTFGLSEEGQKFWFDDFQIIP